jgi:hypothetical protein
LRTLLPFLLALLVAGCGSKGNLDNPSMRLNSLTQAARNQAFQGVTLAELAGWDRPANAGKRVAVRARVERVTYALGYGETYHGYRLVDADHHTLICQNLYSVVTAGTGGRQDDGHDLSRAGQRMLLLAGAPVFFEGVYYPSHSASSHGGVYTVPAGLEVLRIEGQTVEALRGS